jgi:NADH-quinone oxidoreductase subunit L
MAMALPAGGEPIAPGPMAGKLVPLSGIALLIPGLPLLAAVLCALMAWAKIKSKLPAFTVVACLAGSFAASLWMYFQIGDPSGANAGAHAVVHAFDWMTFVWGVEPGQTFVANFSFYVDSLTCLWMLFVTGLATMIALYASEYMSHDLGRSYCRFFFAFGLFVFSMACLVMGDNLLLLYLGWEGVGLCSYLLIGYFYTKPSAVAAAKKAFILNRIGDLGLALGILLTFVTFGSIEYAVLFEKIKPYLTLVQEGKIDQIPMQVQLIALLFTVGAFGKSAQLPLYVWLPDAMEGPTPVSALIHAATMVTAGVYLLARFLPFYQCSEHALTIVAWVGTLTALLAATIGMAQFDIKRIMAYSTVSQLGYMFAGLGVLGSTYTADAAGGSAYHVFTHAFFKATLFLSCGAVMHGFAGQLDLRKLSGVMWMKGWLIVGLAMLVGCLNLAGFPFTAGFFSKDMILANAFSNHHLTIIGWILLLTAGLTAYYTFRVFFRVFVGPKLFEPGDEQHGHDDHGHDDHSHGQAHGHGHDHAQSKPDAHASAPAGAHAHDFHPHPPGWAINTVLAGLALASVVAAIAYMYKWVNHIVVNSTARLTTMPGVHEHATLFGQDPHKIMYYVSGVVGAIGIATAFVLHFAGRKTSQKAAADAFLPVLGPIAKAAQHKWYVDEIYDWIVRRPLKVLSHIFALLDKFVVDGLVDLFGFLPRLIGRQIQPSQSGVLHGYALGMVCGVVILVLVALFAVV